jgi:hypothetical protein
LVEARNPKAQAYYGLRAIVYGFKVIEKRSFWEEFGEAIVLMDRDGWEAIVFSGIITVEQRDDRFHPQLATDWYIELIWERSF